MISIVTNINLITNEVLFHKKTKDTEKAIKMMLRGCHSIYFWFGILFSSVFY